MNIYAKIALAFAAAVASMFLIDPWWVGAIFVAAMVAVFATIMILAWLASAEIEKNRAGQ